jgi:PAS domain-containing protein
VSLGRTDAQDRIRLVNDASERLFGFTREEVPLLRDWYRRVYPDPA